MQEIIETVPNFSEGRRSETVAALCQAMQSVAGVTLLDREMDHDHNRSVITLVGARQPIAEATFRGVQKAAELIDLNQHQGEHPRMGACDVLPFVPVRGATMADCVALAHQVGKRIGSELQIPVFLYEEAATRPQRKNLAEVRKGQFEGLRDLIGTDPERDPDFGPRRIHPTAGAIAVGARFFLIAYNVNLNSDDLGLAKSIAKRIREKDGGFACVKAMGFLLKERGLAQVSMNLTNFQVTPVLEVFREIKRLAAEKGVAVLESELVGLAPRAALDAQTLGEIELAQFEPKKQIIEELLGP
ncbi:MAG: glutamate formimidoyltransferase [Planctomycetota bacterium]